MRLRLLTIPVLALLLGASVFAQVQTMQRQARDAAIERTGSAEISGVLLTEGDTPQPIRLAEVRAIGAGGPPRIAYTDAQGRFAFHQLPYGRYTLEATKAGFVRSAYGARRYDRPGTPVTLDPSTPARHVEWQMARGAVIAGRITDEFGHPAQGARVSVQLVRVINGQRTLVQVPQAASILGEVVDDRGEYRLFGLPAGDYVLSATPRTLGMTDIRRMSDAELQAAQQATPQTSEVPTTLGFSQVYFPGVLTSDAATPITVRTGEVRDGTDFVISLVRTAALEGVVVTPGDVPPASVQLTLVPRGGSQTTVSSVPGATTVVFATSVAVGGQQRVLPDGTFSYGGVTPGQYTLNARATRQGGAPLWASVDVDVDGYTIGGLSLVLQEGLTVSGTLAFDADGVDPPETFTQARILFIPTGGGMVTMNLNNTTVNERGFEVRGLVPGPIQVNANFNTPEVNWQLRSAVINGRDVLDLPFVLGPNDRITDAVLTFTNRTQTITGTLSDASQRPAPDYTIVVFPEDPSLWPARRRVRTVRPGTDGRFTLTGLPPGRYRIAAVTDIAPDETQDLALLQELADASLGVTLAAGATVVQDIRIAGLPGS